VLRTLKLVVQNCLVLILLVVVCEAGASAIRALFDSSKARQADQEMIRPEGLDPGAFSQFVKEQNGAWRFKWTSYAYWRRVPMSGKYVNVDANGLRRTWNPSPLAPRHVRVFVFGGSTMWGTGSRDDYTIASQLSKTLAKSFGSGVEVVNFGESGYVQTQELITLLKEIQRGNVPDLAVFYDGYNDVFSAFQNSQAGLPQNEQNRVREFNLLQSGPHFYAEWARQSSLFWLVSGAAGHVGWLRRFAPQPKQTGAASQADVSSPKLTSDALAVYGANLRMLQSIAAQYHIRTFHFWQPTVYSKEQKSPEEKGLANQDPSFAEFYLMAMEQLKDSPFQGISSFHDLTHAFDGRPERIFIDTMHVSESGNEHIAGLIESNIAGAVSQMAQSPRVAEAAGHAK